MSRAKVIIVAAFLAAFGITVVIAQLPPEDGMSMIRDAFIEMSRPSGAEACRLRYSIRTISVDGSHSSESVVDVDYVASDDRYHWITREIEFYSDGSIMILVDNKGKSIHISPCGKDYEQRQAAAIAQTIPDSLFRYGRLLSWEELESGERKEGSEIVPDRRAVLLTSNGLRTSTLVDTIAVELNAHENKLRKVVLSYVPGCEIDRVEATYNSIDVIDEPDEFDRPLRSVVFNGDGTVRSAYNGFDVIDMVTMREEFGAVGR